MSAAGADIAVLAAPGRGRAHHTRREAAAPIERPGVRVAAFGALALYGALRWATLMHPASVWRLLGLVCVSTTLVAAAAAIPNSTRLARSALIVLAVLGCLAALALAGIPVRWIRYVRISVGANAIGEGLSALPGLLVPYLGINEWVRLVITLGAAVLLLDAAVMLAFAPAPISPGRRAASAVPLIALAVVPATLVRPELPYVQGLLLFALIALFMWCEQIRNAEWTTAGGLAILAATAAMVAAPALEQHSPWLNYQAIASKIAASHVDAFDWAQRYGPLNTPRSGHPVLEVHARHADYWKAENLDFFDGFGWGQASLSAIDPEPTVTAAHLRRWSQTVQVTLRSMRSSDLLAAGYATDPTDVQGTLVAGMSPGTWTDVSGLNPGDSYKVTTYDPRPTPTELRGAGNNYPPGMLPAYLTMLIPLDSGPNVQTAPLSFVPFHTSLLQAYGAGASDPAPTMQQSPYAPAFRLAQRLASQSATPYDFALQIERFLSIDNGFVYDENTTSSQFPLETFLFSTRRGYCQQFAGAMAMLLRMGGVPARVAVGFTTGKFVSATSSYVPTDIDAHAWVEAWFPTYGWVRFDPTPASAPELSGSVRAALNKGKIGGANRAKTHASHGLGALSRSAAARRGSHASGISIALMIVGLLALVLLVLAIAITVRLSPPTGEQLLDELERAFARSGRPLRRGTTLAQLEQRLGGADGAIGYVRALRLARFAGAPGQAPTRAQRRALRGALRAGGGLAAVVRSLWALPPRITLTGRVSEAPATGIHST